jgi:uncharacterized protein YdbL (DUF1318 family)
MRAKIMIGSALLPTLFFACSIKAPEVKVTGEKTALEKEVIGTYSQMEEDTWMVASTRSAKGQNEVNISPEKQRVLEAMQQQKFNKDDVSEFKQKGYVGENNRGLLEIRSMEGLENDSDDAKLIQEIVLEENADRKIIMERVIELNEKLKKSVQDDVLGIFAKMNQENAPVGTWVQGPDGKWAKK